jgi:hypothetical protein
MISGGELIKLGIPLRRVFALRGFPVWVGVGAVIKPRLKIDPDCSRRVALVFGCGGSLGQAEMNQDAIEDGKLASCRFVDR